MKFAVYFVILFAAAGLAGPPSTTFARDQVQVAQPRPNSNLDLARQLNQAFVELAEQVSPAVVVVTVTEKAVPASRFSGASPDENGDDPLDKLPPELRRFFRHRSESMPSPSEPTQPTRGQGSGIILRPDGYILTNRHVVEEAQKIEVRLKDGRTFKAEVRGVDAPSDVAVIKIDAHDLPVAKLADSSKTRVGEFAIAIGAPFALDYSVTFGHVSAMDRSNIFPSEGEEGPTMTDQSFIQTDANINPGNSGGPLVNINGEVIGINTLIRGLHTGIGFAIPVNLAREVAEKLITDGKFTRPWLGVTIRSLREYPEVKDLVPGVQDGVVIYSISPDGPVAKSDLHPGDVITAVDGKKVITSQQLKDEIRSKRVGQSVALDVYRVGRDGKGSQVKISVKPGEYQDKTTAIASGGSPSPESNTTGGLGVTVKALTRDLADRYNVDLVDGVLVTSVDKNGLAAAKGIKAGDIITSVNHQPVGNLREFRDLTRNLNTKKGVIVNLISEGTPRFEVLREGDD
jgi:serine protease Do